MVSRNASRMRSGVISARTVGMARMNSTVMTTLVVTLMTQASAVGYKPRMTRWTGHEIKEQHHLSTQVMLASIYIVHELQNAIIFALPLARSPELRNLDLRGNAAHQCISKDFKIYDGDG